MLVLINKGSKEDLFIGYVSLLKADYERLMKYVDSGYPVKISYLVLY